MLRLFKETRINFMKYKYFAFGLSATVILAGILNITLGKGLKPGVDFAGGTLIRIKFKNPVPVGQVRQLLTDNGLGGSLIQEIEKGRKEYQVRTMGLTGEEGSGDEIEAHEIMGVKVVDALKTREDQAALEKGLVDLNIVGEKEVASLLAASFPDQATEIARSILAYRTERGIIEDFSRLREAGINPQAVSLLQEKAFTGSLTVLSKETVGPQVGKELRRKAAQATVWALLGMLIYIAVRFKFAYGVSAILTLTHDVLVTLSIFSFTNREISLPVIAAILTIVGFSLNDTIVIFDRVRENLKIQRKSAFEPILNLSLNQTLSRSIITSGTVFLTVLSLFLFGGEVINDFAFTMIIGVISGSYSTIYQSCPIVYYWQNIFPSKRGFRK